MTRRDERRMLTQCAPALTGVKAGSLLKIDKTAYDDALNLLSSFKNKDVGTKVLSPSGPSLLILVYRRRMLETLIEKRETAEFLRGLGYSGDLDDMLGFLSERMCQKIEHELGIFLGYPLCDVKGFIENKGKDFKSAGCWKVYGDVPETEALFTRIRRSRSVCLSRFDAGYSFRSSAHSHDAA